MLTFLCKYFLKYRYSLWEQQRIIAEIDQQVQVNMQALDKQCFKSSHLGVGCPEVEMYVPAFPWKNFLTCIQISQEAGKVVWYSRLLKNFPQFVVIHTVQGFN